MKTPVFAIIIVTLVLTLAWLFTVEEHSPLIIGCTMEAKMCPDGSFVGRTGPECTFAECPTSEVPPTRPETPNTNQPEPVACTMDAMICPDGTAVGRIAPNCEFAPCPNISELIVVQTPVENQTITSPVTIQGSARGSWFFEASFPISIVNWDGLIIGEGIATAQGDWMTEEFVPFTASITYTIPKDTPYNRGSIILKKDNPSGLPEHDRAIEIPILFSEVN